MKPAAVLLTKMVNRSSIPQKFFIIVLGGLAFIAILQLYSLDYLNPTFAKRVEEIQGRIQIMTEKDGQIQDVSNREGRIQNKGNSEKLSKYAVDTWACRIPWLDPYDKEISKLVYPPPLPHCQTRPALTYVEGEELKFNLTVLHERYNVNMSCEYEGVLKNYVLTGFRPIKVGKNFKPGFEFITVQCYSGEEILYRDFHAFVPFKAAKSNPNIKIKKWNVFLLGTDSISHSAFIRYFKKTKRYLIENMEAIELQGYNVVGSNTLPNMLPLWTGLTKEEALPNDTMRPDHLPFIFKDYSKAGYKTLYGEDSPTWTMNYLRKSFYFPPTDYYWHPLARKTLVDNFINLNDCEKRLLRAEKFRDYLLRFIKSVHVQRENYFIMSHFSTLSHTDIPMFNNDEDRVSNTRYSDDLYLQMLTTLKNQGTLENTILFFFSDHGARGSAVAKSFVGRVETRLPMMYIVLPKAFKKMYPQSVKNMKTNIHRLTTPFDIHQTLLHILNLNGGDNRYKKSWAQSLFTEIAKERTCDMAHILGHFCTCFTERIVDTKDLLVQQAAEFLIDEITSILADALDVCIKPELGEVNDAVQLLGAQNDSNAQISTDEDISHLRHYRLTITTKTAGGIFYGTVSVNTKRFLKIKDSSAAERRKVFKLEGPMTRNNLYGGTSRCVQDKEQRLFCYCKFNLKLKKH